MKSSWIKYGALMGALAVVLGVFEPSIERFLGGEQAIGQRCQTVVDYAIISMSLELANRLQMLHASALVTIGLLVQFRQNVMLTASGSLLLVGTIGFVGSTYALAALGWSWLHWVAVVNVVILVAGWLALVEGACPGFRSKECRVD